MRILYVTPSLQHPMLRGQNRHYWLLRELATRHDVIWVTSAREPIPAAAMEELTAYTEELHLHYAAGEPGEPGQPAHNVRPSIGTKIIRQRARRQAVGSMRRTFLELAATGRIDVVLFHGKECYHVIDGWNALPLVIDFCDATSLRVRTRMQHASPARKVLLAIRYLQVRSIERRMIGQTKQVAFISQRDRAAILGANSRACVIPNGIDLDYWTRRATPDRDANTLIFTGVMDYAPNEDAALHLLRNILPPLRGRVPELKIVIAGRNPTESLLEEAGRHPEVTVTGFVEDLRPYLEKATLFVAPLRFASGMQNKLQEAFAMEVPVVSTSAAAEGLHLADGEEVPVCVADNSEEFASSVANLLRHPQAMADMAAKGRRYAERHFCWKASARQFEAMCADAVAGLAPMLEPQR